MDTISIVQRGRKFALRYLLMECVISARRRDTMMKESIFWQEARLEREN